MKTNNTPLPIKDISELKTPCHIIDLDRLMDNLEKINLLKKSSGCKVLLAVKGFSSPHFFAYMQSYIDGISASGLYEAKMGKESFGGFVQTYSPGFQSRNMAEIVKNSNAVVFNSAKQLEAFRDQAVDSGCTCGIRINPLHSEVKKEDANPCREYSRLGIPYPDITIELLQKVEGIHLHTMCEQFPDALEEVATFLIDVLGDQIDRAGSIKWINLGGGQLIGHKDYDVQRASASIHRIKDRFHTEVILEPCEGIVTETGFFATSVCDIVKNKRYTAVLDASPICHLPDAVFRDWRHDIYGELPRGEDGYLYFLSGPTCFAGDTFGEYAFSKPLQIGDILFFKDTAAYSWVKNSTFNGVPFPDMYAFDHEHGLRHVKTYDYDSFVKSL